MTTTSTSPGTVFDRLLDKRIVVLGQRVMAGLAVYDTMQLVPNDVATVAVGFAASLGQILLCAGAPGKRYADDFFRFYRLER